MFAKSKLIKQTHRNGKPYSAMLDWMYRFKHLFTAGVPPNKKKTSP